MIGVLKGACTFLSDLMRAADIPLGVEFMAISSYGVGMRTSGEVRILKDLDVPIEGRHILVVEDIVDTGLTLSYLLANLKSRGAAWVKLAALLDKFERREKEVPIDYLGFQIPDEFVVGYGLDFAERYRNLPYIAVVKNPDAYFAGKRAASILCVSGPLCSVDVAGINCLQSTVTAAEHPKRSSCEKNHSSFAALLVLAANSSAFAQQDWSKVEIKSTKVAGNVYMLQGSGGNIGVSVGADGILIVDDQYAPLADKIKAALKTLGEGKLKFVLNTHWHGDHTGGNAAFSPEAPIIAHTNVRKRLAEGMNITGRKVQPAPKEALPVVTFDHSVSIHFNGEEIRVIHFPRGHTDGDAIIFFTNSNVVHMGDCFSTACFPSLTSTVAVT